VKKPHEIMFDGALGERPDYLVNVSLVENPPPEDSGELPKFELTLCNGAMHVSIVDNTHEQIIAFGEFLVRHGKELKARIARWER
jgi:hypothetical protein